jgi:CRISPR/Cas system-associated protein Cas10 (large subunit of type III CRISPR-Cas system)
MLVKEYKIKTEYTRTRAGKEILYYRHKTMYDIKCDACDNVFTEHRDISYMKIDRMHLCSVCRKNNLSPVRQKINRAKENPEKIGTIRLHRNSKYKEIFVGIDSWHTKIQGHWCREHIYIIEEEIGYRIPAGYVVHHIDGDKCNNKKENLDMMTVQEHNNAHSKSESIIFQLVKSGLITFNRQTKLYEII